MIETFTAMTPTSPLIRYPWIIPGLLLLLTLLVYANSFPGTFVLDDLHIVQNNGLVSDPDLFTIFTTDYWHGFENSGLFRPVTILSLAMNRLLFGADPLGFHVVNVLLHAFAGILLWLVLRGFRMTDAVAGVAAGFFIIHPIHGEVVNIVVGRSELLVAVFLLGAFYLARRDGAGAVMGVCFLYLLALCSKEHAITFLALLPLTDFYFYGFSAWRRRWPLYAGLLAVAGSWLIWRQVVVIGQNPLPPFPLTEAANPIAFIDPLSRVLTALHYQGLYLAKLLVPYDLQSVYSSNDLPLFIRSIFSPAGLLVSAATVIVLFLLLVGWSRRTLLALFGSTYLITFLPTSNLFFPLGAAFAERLAYFPSVWYCAALGALLAVAMDKWRRPKLWWGVCLCYGLFLAGSLLARNLDYGDEITLWSAEVAVNPTDFLGWQSLAESYNNSGRFEEADQAYRTMLALAPDYPGGLRSRTAFFTSLGLYEEALVSAEKVFALSKKQNEPIAMAFDGVDLAEVALHLNDCQRTMELLDGPSLPLRNHQRNLELRAVALACLDRHEEAVQFFSRVEGEPKEHRIRYRHGLSLFHLKDFAAARVQLEEAVKMNDQDVEAWNLLGVVRAELKDWPAAISAMERATALAPDNAHYRENLDRARQLGR